MVKFLQITQARPNTQATVGDTPTENHDNLTNSCIQHTLLPLPTTIIPNKAKGNFTPITEIIEDVVIDTINSTSVTPPLL